MHNLKKEAGNPGKCCQNTDRGTWVLWLITKQRVTFAGKMARDLLKSKIRMCFCAREACFFRIRTQNVLHLFQRFLELSGRTANTTLATVPSCTTVSWDIILQQQLHTKDTGKRFTDRNYWIPGDKSLLLKISWKVFGSPSNKQSVHFFHAQTKIIILVRIGQTGTQRAVLLIFNSASAACK